MAGETSRSRGGPLLVLTNQKFYFESCLFSEVVVILSHSRFKTTPVRNRVIILCPEEFGVNTQV